MDAASWCGVDANRDGSTVVKALIGPNRSDDAMQHRIVVGIVFMAVGPWMGEGEGIMEGRQYHTIHVSASMCAPPRGEIPSLEKN